MYVFVLVSNKYKKTIETSYDKYTSTKVKCVLYDIMMFTEEHVQFICVHLWAIPFSTKASLGTVLVHIPAYVTANK